MRVLTPEHIPDTLWSGGRILLPPVLVKAYQEELESRNLYQDALIHVSGEIYGGATQEETDAHFTQRFVTSASRALYVLLSPCRSFDDASNTIVAALSYGHVGILDIPCGTGAMSIAIITLLIELRTQNVLPKLPLSITICAGDYSSPSRSIFSSMLSRLVGEASAVGITIVHDIYHWDALNHQDTAELVDRWFESTVNSTDHLVTILNFSGEMHKDDIFEKFSPSLNQVLARLYNRKGAVVWLEPGTNNAKKNLRGKVIALMEKVSFLAFLVPRYKEGQRRSADYKVCDPLTSVEFPSSVTEICFYSYLPREVSCQQI